MIALLQRVSFAEVVVDNEVVATIDTGVLAFIGIEQRDDNVCAENLLERLLHYRLFSDEAGKMNLNLQQIHGGLLLVPQFTLVADTHKGLRPSFTRAAAPSKAKEIFAYLVRIARERHTKLATGQFGADMQVKLVNTGPVTFWLETS